MNENIKEFIHKQVNPGFIKALVGDDFVYELIGTYISYDKPLNACIHDDTQKNEFDAVEKLADKIYIEGAEIIDVYEEDTDVHAFVYRSDENEVLFIIKKSWSIAIWN